MTTYRRKNPVAGPTGAKFWGDDADLWELPSTEIAWVFSFYTTQWPPKKLRFCRTFFFFLIFRLFFWHRRRVLWPGNCVWSFLYAGRRAGSRSLVFLITYVRYTIHDLKKQITDRRRALWSVTCRCASGRKSVVSDLGPWPYFYSLGKRWNASECEHRSSSLPSFILTAYFYNIFSAWISQLMVVLIKPSILLTSIDFCTWNSLLNRT